MVSTKCSHSRRSHFRPLTPATPTPLRYATAWKQAIAANRGYEVCTEGDAFCVAFHTPDFALGFALHVQVGLGLGVEELWKPNRLVCVPPLRYRVPSP